MILQTTLVQTCNYEGFNFKPMEREKTFNPHETLIFAITVNLLIFEEKFDETRLLFQRRKYNAKAFPNQLDLSASGYVFNKETPNEALRRIVKKELDIDLDEDLIRDMYLLAWLPNGDDNKNNLRYSKGYLYICNRKDIEVKNNLFKSINITKCLDDKTVTFKPDTKSLLRDSSAMMKIANFIKKKLKVSEKNNINKKSKVYKNNKIISTIKPRIRIEDSLDILQSDLFNVGDKKVLQKDKLIIIPVDNNKPKKLLEDVNTKDDICSTNRDVSKQVNISEGDVYSGMNSIKNNLDILNSNYEEDDIYTDNIDVDYNEFINDMVELDNGNHIFNNEKILVNVELNSRNISSQIDHIKF